MGDRLCPGCTGLDLKAAVRSLVVILVSKPNVLGSRKGDFFLKRWFSPGGPLADGCAVGGVPAAACAHSQAGSLCMPGLGGALLRWHLCWHLCLPVAPTAPGQGDLFTNRLLHAFSVLGVYLMRIGFGGSWLLPRALCVFLELLSIAGL